MSIISPRRVAVGAIVTLLLTTGLPAQSRGEHEGASRPQGTRGGLSNLYIVRMVDDPVVGYRGGTPGLQATRPNRGQKIDPNNPAVVQYAAYLDARHDQAIAAAGGGRKVYDYRYSFNGFAAELSDEQAATMATVPGVLSVTRNEVLTLDTSSTPSFLGLSVPGGLWDQLGGVEKAGEDVIIGVVDGGIWPESLSFSDRTGTNGNASKTGKLDYYQLPGWHGRCVPGEEFTGTDCNQKLIGAQHYNAGWGGDAGIDVLMPFEYNSARDFGGHGTHTASTAGGNANVPTTGAASVFGRVSGIAPRARIAAYKACWAVPGTAGSCQGVDTVAAIDQAVADGVDVINYSISGTTTNFRDAVEIAFLFAADAGVFVATSAGNSGPTTSTVAHPGPWLTTVAAGTHNRKGSGSVRLGNGSSYSGASVATAVSAPLINSTAAGLPGVDATKLALCYSSADGAVVLDPAKVAGKIVVCQRGVTARVNKSLAVQQAGGVGMILFNNPDSSLIADFHFVPTVHVTLADGTAIKAYAAQVGATASIAQATIGFDTPAPFTASFSSRGPLRAGSGDLLKPDLSAPGQDILAAVAPPGNSGRDFDLYSGTSMSSPHVAGLAALLKNRHPDWSPMMIKSALMTSATDVLDGPNTNPLVIFRQGAGHVRPNSAVDPGLVFDSGFTDWLNFICGTQPGPFCSAYTAIDPSNLNVASIAIGDLAGVQTVTRSVTNVGSATESYTATYTGLTGISVALPAAMTIAKGATQPFQITFTAAGAPPNGYVGGQLTLTGNRGHVVRVPMVVRPVALAAPAQVSGSYTVTFGYNGPFSVTPRGLIPAVINAATVNQDPDQTFSLTDPTGTVAIPVTVPAGTTYARFSLFDADVAPGSDIDMYVYRGSTRIGSSTSGSSAEEVNVVFSTPTAAPDTYTVYIHGWGLPAGSSPFALHAWALGTASAGNMAVAAPPAATIGATGAVTLTFTGLTAGTKYLGSVVYAGSPGMPSPTIVRVDP